MSAQELPPPEESIISYDVDFVPHTTQHATAVPERWSVVGGGWGPNPRTLNVNSQNFKGVGQDVWPRAVERSYRPEGSELHRRAMDQQYRDALNNERDDEINKACEAEAEREVKAIYDSAAEVTRRANYRAQHLRELAWREEQQQAHIAKEMEAEQQLAAAHLAEEEKRQWLEAQQEAAAARASYARQLAVRDAQMRSQVETEANAHMQQVIAAEEDAGAYRDAERKQSDLDAFRADIAARRLAGQVERERHRTFVDAFDYKANRARLPDPIRHSPATKPRSLVYPIRGWRHKSLVN